MLCYQLASFSCYVYTTTVRLLNNVGENSADLIVRQHTVRVEEPEIGVLKRQLEHYVVEFINLLVQPFDACVQQGIEDEHSTPILIAALRKAASDQVGKDVCPETIARQVVNTA